jgi:APA family basic amino acid/polyamine antiporter
MGLWSKKSVTALQAEAAAAEASGHGLKRTLTALNLTMLGIGAIIGAGIFVLTGTAAANFAGPGIAISFVLAGTACLFAGLCYAEFASMIPIAGSAYTYGYATMGEFIAWLIGWNLILEYLFAASTVAVGWSGYFVALMGELGITIPAAFAGAPFDVQGTHTLVRSQICVDPATSGVMIDKVSHAVVSAANCATTGGQVVSGIVNLPAVVLVAAVTMLLVRGIKESANFNNAVVIVKMIIVALVIGLGFFYVNKANWTPFIPPNEGEWGKYGWSGVLRASSVIFFAYIGFDAVSTAAQEAKNPQRDLPIGILASLAICTVLYILMSLVMTGLAPFKDLNVPHPVFVAIERAGPALKWLQYLINLGAVAGLASVVLVMLMGQPRIFYTMAKDGLLPPVFGTVHPKYQTPAFSTIVTGAIALVIAALFPIGLLGELVSIGTLFAFAIVCLGILVLRKTSPDLKRPFRTPGAPIVPLLGALCSLALMGFLPPDTWIRLAVWTAIGLAVYFGYGMRNSRAGGATG